jgi:hypothetical protein
MELSHIGNETSLSRSTSRVFPVIVIPQLLQTYHHINGVIQLLQVAAAIKIYTKKACDSADYVTSGIEFRTRPALFSR